MQMLLKNSFFNIGLYYRGLQMMAQRITNSVKTKNPRLARV